MAFGLIGKKIGMTQIFADDGRVTPVTALQVGPCVVLDKMTVEKNGYVALKLGFGEVKDNRVRNPQKVFFKKNNLKPVRYMKEFRLANTDEYNVGDVLDVSAFSDIQYVDVAGMSKGKGYQGPMKRWGMGGGPAAHGSHFHRALGSSGMCEFPGRIFKNSHMAGRMGYDKVTTQNLKVVKIDKENNVIFVKGAVPGKRTGIIYVRFAVKKQNVK